MKQFYTTLILLFMALTINSQTLISETTEQFDNLIVNTKTYNDGATEYHLRTVNSVPTDVTNWLLSQAPCGFSGGCETIILGCCQGDGVDSSTNGGVCTFPDFQYYTISETIELVWDTFRAEHCQVKFINGSSLINNGIQFVESTFCDVGDEVTEYIFEGGGNEFTDRAAYEATLSTPEFELTRFTLPVGETYILYDAAGRRLYSGPITPNTETDLKQFSGLNYLKVFGYKALKIIN